MSLALVVRCDSDPAPYAGGDPWPCRAWRTTRGETVMGAHLEVARDGWTVELLTEPDGSHTYRHTCPACVRSLAALGRVR